MRFLRSCSSVWRATLVVLTVAALAIPIVLAPAAGAAPTQAPPTPSIVVEPSSDLGDGQDVTVTGSGWATSPEVTVMQCADVPPVDGNAQCDIQGVVGVDGSGGFAFTSTVHNPMMTNTALPTTQYDCLVVDCLIVVTQGETSVEHPLSFAEPGTLSGTVRDTTGEPVAFVTVTACVAPGTPGSGCIDGFTGTDANGNYSIQLPEGTYNIVAEVDGVPVTQATVTVVAGEVTVEDLTVPLVTLSGMVRASDGAPLEEALIIADCLDSESNPAFCRDAAQTDAAGNYTMQLAPGPYRITASHSSASASAEETVSIESGQRATLDFTLPVEQPPPAVGTLSGTVRDTNGDPLQGALIAACPAPGSPGPGCFQGPASTDGAGSYTLQLAPGEYNVAAVHGPTRSPDESVTIVSGETTNQDFTLPLGKISGSVLDANGEPFPAGTAGFGACPAPGAALFCPGARTASADAAGNYTLRLEAGSYNVAGFTTQGGISGGGFTPVEVAVGETITCNVQMPGAPVCDPPPPPALGTVSGTVRDTTGEPLPGILVGACPAPGTPGPSCVHAFTVTDGAGNYTLPLAPGEYNVSAVHGPQGFVTRDDGTVTVEGGETTSQDFTLPLGKVSGSVLDGDGQPFPTPTTSAFFGACPAPGAALFCPGAQTAPVDAAGNYTLRLAAGDYNVAGVVNDGGLVLGGIEPITVAVGETITCNVQFPSPPACGADEDGVPDEVEDGAPNGGDGNDDGTPDSEQENVTSLPNAVDGQYVTLASPAGSTLVGVTAIDPATLPPPPPGTELPVGVLTFEVHGLAPGASTTVELLLPTDVSSDAYFKFQNGAWSEFVGATIDGNHVSLALTDGGAGDGDGVANGVIVDPGAPTVLPRVPQSKEDCKNGGWKDLVDDKGRPFKNQGDCVSFVATKGKNKAKD